jgi:hypothetical protein
MPFLDHKHMTSKTATTEHYQIEWPELLRVLGLENDPGLSLEIKGYWTGCLGGWTEGGPKINLTITRSA